MSITIPLDDLTKAKIVYMILNKKTEEALQHLSKFYNMTPPEIVVGTVKGKRKTVLHEFYHHIRTKGGIHRGSEKNANMYAKSFIDAYNRIIKQITESHLESKRKKKETGNTQ
jgi:ribosome-associated translation inhibitor RaiA